MLSTLFSQLEEFINHKHLFLQSDWPADIPCIRHKNPLNMTRVLFWWKYSFFTYTLRVNSMHTCPQPSMRNTFTTCEVSIYHYLTIIRMTSCDTPNSSVQMKIWKHFWVSAAPDPVVQCLSSNSQNFSDCWRTAFPTAELLVDTDWTIMRQTQKSC